MTTTLTRDNKPATALQSQVHEVLDVLGHFSTLLTNETDALKKSDFQTVDTLQQNKRDIARKYQELVSALSTRQTEMATLDQPLREKLIKARTAFTLILQENMVTLEAVKKSTQRLVNRILDVARDTVTEETHHKYAANGKMQSATSSSLSLSLDQKF
jgi:tRNA A37 threonylcarbamoyltransferase TsaD